MALTHLYAIVRADDSLQLGVAGVDGAEVRTVAHGGFAALFSRSETSDYRSLDRERLLRCLLAHQRVVETAMREHTVLPVKFGTLLPDEALAREALAQGKSVFREGLRTLAGCVQMEVVAMWRLEDVLQEIAHENEVARLVSKAESASTGGSTDGRVAVGRMVHLLLEQRRAVLRDALVQAFREIGGDLIVNPNLDDSIVLNMALLVDDSKRAILDRSLDMLDSTFAPKLSFRCVGPLPPYSFATVEIEQPAFEEVDAARRLLELGEAADAAEIKTAYYRLAGASHPDIDPDNPEAQERMSRISEAHKLLTRYAECVARRRGGSEVAVCSFDQQSVENALLVSVRRQESQA